MSVIDVEVESGPVLHIRVLDGFAAECSDGRSLNISNRKACGLLAYLALNQTGNETRERIAGLLWSERGEDQARASLRQCLKQLRMSFDGCDISCFQAGRSEVLLDLHRVRTDVSEVIEAAERGGIHSLLLNRKRLSETLLTGFDEVDPSFRVWLLVQRQSLHERLARALEDALQDAGSRSDIQSSKRLSEALINLDPTHEEACQHLMRAYAELGDISGALRTYKALWEILDDEYGMEPSEQTQNLIASIKMGEIVASEIQLPGLERDRGMTENLSPQAADVMQTVPDAAPPVPAGPKLALVVDKFETPGVPQSSEHVCEGFRHDLISRLVRFREWTVRDGESGPASGQPADCGAGLYHVKVKFYQDDNTLNLILTVMAGDTGVYVWSDRFGVSLDQFFDSQRQVVRRIAAALNIHLSMERLTRISGAPDVSLDIYDRWLLAQSLGARWRPENDRRAEQIFRSLIEEAPDFSPAYSSLVGILNSRHHSFPGIRRSRERETEALSLARLAVQNDPVDTRSQLSLAWSHAMNGQHDNAAFHFSMAHDLNTSDVWTLVSAALGLAYCGSTSDARRFAREALQLGGANAPSHWGYHANIRFICKDFEGCVEAANHAEDTIFYMSGWKAAALAHLGRTDEARAEARHFFDLIAGNWHGEDVPSPEAITTWFLEAFPIREEVTRESLRAGFLTASAPLYH